MAGSRNRFIKRKPKKKVVKPARSRAENRRSSSSSSRTIPASKRPADMRKGVTYGDAGRPYKGPGGNPNGSGQGQARQAPPAPKLPPRPGAGKPPKKAPAPAKPRKAPVKTKPAKATKPARKTSTTKGPTKSGGYYQSKGSSTKGGPTKSGSSYAGKRKPRTWLKDNYKPGAKGIKSSRLSAALSNLKVRDYNKKKK